MGIDPRPYTLRRLYQMASGRWEFEVGTVATAVGMMFANGGERPKNPFDRRRVREQTDAEKAELAAAQERIDRIRQRVNERRLKREAEANGGRGQ
jgi:hypothetical protein